MSYLHGVFRQVSCTVRSRRVGSGYQDIGQYILSRGRYATRPWRDCGRGHSWRFAREVHRDLACNGLVYHIAGFITTFNRAIGRFIFHGGDFSGTRTARHFFRLQRHVTPLTLHLRELTFRFSSCRARRPTRSQRRGSHGRDRLPTNSSRYHGVRGGRGQALRRRVRQTNGKIFRFARIPTRADSGVSFSLFQRR